MVSSKYKDLDEKLMPLDPYIPIHITSYEPEMRYERRHWVDNLKLSSDKALMKESYWSRIGNINIKVVRDVNHETNMAKTGLSANSKLPEYHTKQIRKEFVEKFQKIANINRSGLTEIYEELEGDEIAHVMHHDNTENASWNI